MSNVKWVSNVILKFHVFESIGRALKYTHFELKNTVIQENEFPRLI